MLLLFRRSGDQLQDEEVLDCIWGRRGSKKVGLGSQLPDLHFAYIYKVDPLLPQTDPDQVLLLVLSVSLGAKQVVLLCICVALVSASSGRSSVTNECAVSQMV